MNFTDPTGHVVDAGQVKGLPGIETALTDWDRDSFLDVDDLYLGLRQGRIGLQDYLRINTYPVYGHHGGLEIRGINSGVGPGGNRIAEFRALVAPPNPQPPPASPPVQAAPYYQYAWNFALGFIPGYDLVQARNDPEAGLVDYALAAAAIVPGEGKAASAGLRGLGNISGGIGSVEEVLAGALKWLGMSYKEISPGVFRSTENASNQFRMTTESLIDPRQGPHVHFESIGPDGRTIIENSHVKIK